MSQVMFNSFDELEKYYDEYPDAVYVSDDANLMDKLILHYYYRPNRLNHTYLCFKDLDGDLYFVDTVYRDDLQSINDIPKIYLTELELRASIRVLDECVTQWVKIGDDDAKMYDESDILVAQIDKSGHSIWVKWTANETVKAQLTKDQVRLDDVCRSIRANAYLLHCIIDRIIIENDDEVNFKFEQEVNSLNLGQKVSIIDVIDDFNGLEHFVEFEDGRPFRINVPNVKNDRIQEIYISSAKVYRLVNSMTDHVIALASLDRRWLYVFYKSSETDQIVGVMSCDFTLNNYRAVIAMSSSGNAEMKLDEVPEHYDEYNDLRQSVNLASKVYNALDLIGMFD